MPSACSDPGREGFVVDRSSQYVRVMFGRSSNDVESMDVAKVQPF